MCHAPLYLYVSPRQGQPVRVLISVKLCINALISNANRAIKDSWEHEGRCELAHCDENDSKTPAVNGDYTNSYGYHVIQTIHTTFPFPRLLRSLAVFIQKLERNIQTIEISSNML